MKGLTGLTVALALLAGCAGFPYGDIQPPEVSLADVQLTKVRLFEQHYRLELRIQNPNDVSLPIGGMDYRLSLNGREFATGVSNQNWTIPAYGDRLVTIDAVTSLGKILEQLRQFEKRREAVDYALTGDISLGRHGPELPFERTGTIRLTD